MEPPKGGPGCSFASSLSWTVSLKILFLSGIFSSEHFLNVFIIEFQSSRRHYFAVLFDLTSSFCGLPEGEEQRSTSTKSLTCSALFRRTGTGRYLFVNIFHHGALVMWIIRRVISFSMRKYFNYIIFCFLWHDLLLFNCDGHGHFFLIAISFELTFFMRKYLSPFDISFTTFSISSMPQRRPAHRWSS